MGLASLGSGSRGNGTLVAMAGSVFLVDCGFTLRQTEQRLARLGLSPGDITAVLVSHEHSDHISGVPALAHRYGVPVYASHGTKKNAPNGFQCEAFDGDIPFTLGEVTINPVRVPHDAREPTQFVLARVLHDLEVHPQIDAGVDIDVPAVVLLGERQQET